MVFNPPISQLIPTLPFNPMPATPNTNESPFDMFNWQSRDIPTSSASGFDSNFGAGYQNLAPSLFKQFTPDDAGLSFNRQNQISMQSMHGSGLALGEPFGQPASFNFSSPGQAITPPSFNFGAGQSYGQSYAAQPFNFGSPGEAMPVAPGSFPT